MVDQSIDVSMNENKLKIINSLRVKSYVYVLILKSLLLFYQFPFTIL